MLFTMICTDKPDSLALRQETRPAHLEYLRGYEPALRFAGPMLDGAGNPCGSLFVVDVADRDAVEALAANDPYAKAGLFETTVIRPVRQVAWDGKLGA